VWFRDPEGTPSRLLETPQARPRDVPEVLFNVGAVHHRFDTPAWQQAQDVLPRRLGHRRCSPAITNSRWRSGPT
jgi:hypothetical protein